MCDFNTSHLGKTDRFLPPSGAVHHAPCETVKGVKPRTGRAAACACGPCKKAHLACDNSRPCKRCVTLSKVDLCVDVVQKKRGRPKLQTNQDSIAASTSRSRTSSTQGGPVRNRTFRTALSQSIRRLTSKSPQDKVLSSVQTSKDPRPSVHQGIALSSSPSNSVLREYSRSTDSPLSVVSTTPTTITLITTIDLYILRCSASSLSLLGREASSISHRWLSSLLVEDDLWAIEQTRDTLTYPTGHRVRTNRPIEELIERLDDAMLESPAEGTSYPDKDVRLKRADGLWEGYNMRMHLGRAGGFDLRNTNTYSNAYIVISLLPLLPASSFLTAKTLTQSNQYQEDDPHSSSHHLSTHSSPPAVSGRPAHHPLDPSPCSDYHSTKSIIANTPSDVESKPTTAFLLGQPVRQDRPTLPSISLLTSTLPSGLKSNINHREQLRPMSSPSPSNSLFRRPFDTDQPDKGRQLDRSSEREQEHGAQPTSFLSSASSLPLQSSSLSSSCSSSALFQVPMNQSAQPVYPNRSSSLMFLLSEQRSPPSLSRRPHPNVLPSLYPSSASVPCLLKRPSIDSIVNAADFQNNRNSSFSTASSVSELWTRPSTSSDSERRSSSAIERPGLEALFPDRSGSEHKSGHGIEPDSFRHKNIGLDDGDVDETRETKTRPGELRIWRGDEDIRPLSGRS